MKKYKPFTLIFTILILSSFQVGAFNNTNDSFSYQGKLLFQGAPANGNYDFKIQAFDSDDIPYGEVDTHLNIMVENGLFIIDNIKLSIFPYEGTELYLEIMVRQGGGNPTYQVLSPRQKISAVPYASTLIRNGANPGDVLSYDLLNGWFPQAPTPHFSGVYSDLTGAPVLATVATSGNYNDLSNQPVFPDTTGWDTNVSDDVTQLDDLSDAKTDSNSLFAGANSGMNNLLNTSNGSGNYNTAFGINTLKSNTTGNNNSAFGSAALENNQTGDNNVAIGAATLGKTNGSRNTSIGDLSGYENLTGSDNVFLGFKAGKNETGSNKLYIENSDSPTPLIGGDFSTDEVVINGHLGVGASPGSQYNIHVKGNDYERVNIESTSNFYASTLTLKTASLSSSNNYVTLAKFGSSAGGSPHASIVPNSNLASLTTGEDAGAMLFNVLSDNSIYLATNDIVRMTVENSGNVLVNNKLTAPDSGDADMKAYIYGSSQNSTGGINTLRSSDGFTISKLNLGKYRVTFDNSPGNIYVANVSVIGSSPLFATVSRSSVYFDVYVWDSAGLATDATFNFVVYKK